MLRDVGNLDCSGVLNSKELHIELSELFSEVLFELIDEVLVLVVGVRLVGVLSVVFIIFIMSIMGNLVVLVVVEFLKSNSELLSAFGHVVQESVGLVGEELIEGALSLFNLCGHHSSIGGNCISEVLSDVGGEDGEFASVILSMCGRLSFFLLHG